MWRGRNDMFTGIIEEIGTIAAIRHGNQSIALTVSCHKVIEGTKIGDSIATGGVCLTVTSLSETGFTADVTPETLRRTAFSVWPVGTRVNLERALTLSSRLGGHLVSGHIDGTGRIVEKRTVGNSAEISVSADSGLMKYILEKGSVAIDGVSLTVAKRETGRFNVSVIPTTAAETTVSERRIGDLVNLECDMVGKYIEQFLKEADGGLSVEKLRTLL